ncbi:MAG: hypothetical protein IPJ34_16970 [Myxococcales bacterium]|nr:hypothetical protein [Myxococcales bacterium]
MRSVGALVGVLLAGLVPTPARAFVPPTFAPATDLAGTYAFSGTDPDGNPETPGIARISRLAPNVYAMVEESEGKVISASRCLRDGDVFACGWGSGPTSDAGTAILTRRADGGFEGTLLEVGRLESRRARAVGTGPSYALEAFSSGIAQPVGAINLVYGNRGIAVMTQPMARGTAFLEGDLLVLGVGTQGFAGTVVYRIVGRTLIGRWIDFSRSGVGTETLSRL